MKSNKKGYLIIILGILIVVNLIPETVNAYANEVLTDKQVSEFKDISIIDNQLSGTRSVSIDNICGREFYIKNMCSGQYLDVAGGIGANGTNVQQYKFNGSEAQRWYIAQNNDSTVSIYSRAGNDGTSYQYCLDINNGSNANYANVQIWTPNGTDSQKFSISLSNYSTFAIFTKISNNSKAIVLNGPAFNQGANIDQYTYQGHYNEFWILEPVVIFPKLGVEYARANYNHYVYSYPKLTEMGGDCANFVSQCMLASGIHYRDSWKVYRNNENYSVPLNVSQLNNTWELCQPNTSPWINASQFGEYWQDETQSVFARATQLLDNPNLIMQVGMFSPGEVVQIANKTLFGNLGKCEHTMYITGYGVYNGNNSFTLTYHSYEQIDKNLLQICAENSNKYLIFYNLF